MFTKDSLPGLQWQKLLQCNEKPHTPVQSAEVGTKSSSRKKLSERVPDIQDADVSSELVATGLNIETQAGRNSHKTLISKTSPVCPQNNKSGLGVTLRDIHASSSSETSPYQYNLRPTKAENLKQCAYYNYYLILLGIRISLIISLFITCVTTNEFISLYICMQLKFIKISSCTSHHFNRIISKLNEQATSSVHEALAFLTSTRYLQHLFHT